MWIYCDKELPEVDQEVNVWLDYARRNVATMRFAGYDEANLPVWLWHNSNDRTTLTVKAWMSLPKGPI